MFIISLTYIAELERVDQFLSAHILFLDEQYRLGNFIASGRKVPRTGGVILCKVGTRTALDQIIEKDPFRINRVADYDVTEFVASKTCEELKFLIE